MKYCLFLVLFLFSFNVLAEDISEDVDNNTPIMIIYPNDNENYLNTDNIPDCNDPKLISEVKSAIENHVLNAPETSIVENRKRKLVLKNIDAYKEIPLSEFKSSDNYLVANELIMTKINKNMTDHDLRLCAGNGSKPIYLLIYPEDFRYRVQIINFIPPTHSGNNFSILYTPPLKQYDTPSLQEVQN